MLLSLAPIALLVVLLSTSVALFGSDASYGPNQVALIIASAATMLVGWRRGMSWQAIQDGMVAAITVSIMPMMILLCVGALIGSWIISGTVPGMIYYGVQLLDPGVFYAASALICALASLSLGSSWTVAGTLGIGLMGIANPTTCLPPSPRAPSFPAPTLATNCRLSQIPPILPQPPWASIFSSTLKICCGRPYPHL